MKKLSGKPVKWTNYTAFGSTMPGRSFTSSNYRYGFNGKENDPETIGTGSGTQDYGMRVYNPALGKFLSVDPLFKEYPHSSVYAFAENGPIENIDRDGEERSHYSISGYEKNGKAILTFERQEDLKDKRFDWSEFKWKTIVNDRREYVIHTGIVYGGNINNVQFEQEVKFTYKTATEFTYASSTLTKKDVDAMVDFYSTRDQATEQLGEIAPPSEGILPYIPPGQVGPIYHRKALTKGFEVPLKSNGAPDFTPFLAPVAQGQRNQFKMTYTGDYGKDFRLADRMAGFTDENPRPANTTWHHVEDYNSSDNRGTMQLVPRNVHEAARHPGGTSQYREANGSGYGK